jgi:predicted MFS family arabinose efflux permease
LRSTFVVAPVVGPTLGGWISDTYSWHWVFLINAPIGLISLFLVGALVNEPSGAEEERQRLLSRGRRIDHVGFVPVAAIVIATTQILPQLLQSELGYTAMLAGLVLSPGGIVTMIMMPITGKLIGMVQPRYLIMAGAAIVALSMWHLTGLNGDVSYGYAALSRIYLAVGLPLLFLPVTTASYEGVPPEKTNQASRSLTSHATSVGRWAWRLCKPFWRNASNSIRAA